jgi:hypothetical protein
MFQQGASRIGRIAAHCGNYFCNRPPSGSELCCASRISAAARTMVSGEVSFKSGLRHFLSSM